MSVGNRDGLNPGGLLRLICDNTGLQSGSIGKIDIMPAFSFFEADQSETDNILRKVNGSEYEGTTVNIEITKDKSGGSSDRGGRSGGFGGKREGGFGGGSPRREGGFGGQRREGGFGGARRDDAPRSSDRRGSFGGARDGGNAGSTRDGGFRSGSDRSGSERGSSFGGNSERRGGFGKPFNKGKKSSF